MPICILDLKSLGKLRIDTQPGQKDFPEKLNASAPSQQYCNPIKRSFLSKSIHASKFLHVLPSYMSLSHIP